MKTVKQGHPRRGSGNTDEVLRESKAAAIEDLHAKPQKPPCS